MRILTTIFLTVLVTLSLVGAACWWLYQRFTLEERRPLAVQVQRPTRGELVETVTAPGVVEPRRKVAISSRITARIAELPHQVGDRVTKGNDKEPASVLVRLDAAELEAQLRSTEARRSARAAEIDVAKAEVESAKAQLEGVGVSLADAERNLRRQQELRESGDVSVVACEQAAHRVEQLRTEQRRFEEGIRSRVLQLEVLRHQLAAADEEIVQARDKLSHNVLLSPIDGVVTRMNAEVGEMVITGTMNNPGTVILEVADLSEMQILAQVDESDVADVAVGQPATVRPRAYADETFAGVVTSVAPVGYGKPGDANTFRVEVAVREHGRRLFPGLSTEVEIETRRHAGALVVPSQAILGRRLADLPGDVVSGNPQVDSRKEFATIVFRVADGKALVTPVRVGASDTMRTIVLAGLAETDSLVTGPFRALETLVHGQRVAAGPAAVPGDPPPAKSDPD